MLRMCVYILKNIQNRKITFVNRKMNRYNMNKILLAVVDNCLMLRMRVVRKYVYQTLNKINYASRIRMCVCIKNIQNRKSRL